MMNALLSQVHTQWWPKLKPKYDFNLILKKDANYKDGQLRASYVTALILAWNTGKGAVMGSLQDSIIATSLF